jgi:hypothetical protein
MSLELALIIDANHMMSLMRMRGEAFVKVILTGYSPSIAPLKIESFTRNVMTTQCFDPTGLNAEELFTPVLILNYT